MFICDWWVMDWGSIADWVSGAMSFAAVVVALRLGLKADRDQLARDRRAERSSAHKTITKLVELTDAFTGMRKQFCAAYETAEPSGTDDQKWPAVQGLGGLLDPMIVRLDPDETDLLLRTGDSELMMNLMLAVRRYSATISALDQYASDRTALMNMFPPPQEVEGRSGTVFIDAGAAMEIRTRAASLEHNLEQLVSMINDTYDLIIDLDKRVPALFRRHFNDPTFPVLVLPAD